MNALEKALLIKELHQLTLDLEHRTLSFYEIARAKQRIKDIFALCDEPIFQKQILSYRALMEPKTAAQFFASGTPFSLSFRGYFQDEYELEAQLYTLPHSGWAFLHDRSKGWQTWLIPAPNRTALISEWGTFEDNYAWMLEMQQYYDCLYTDAELESQSVLLEPIPSAELSNHVPSSANEPHDVPETALETLTPSSETSQIEKNTITDSNALDTAALNPDAELQIFDHLTPAQLYKLPLNASSNQQLYAAHFPDALTISQLHDIVLYGEKMETWHTQPVYIAEQLNLQGRFEKHLILLGAFNPIQAVELCGLFCQHSERQLASVQEVSLHALGTAYQSIDTLFKCCVEQAKFVWKMEQYHSYIPSEAINTQKFIQFDEQDADFSTPILLLEERQKIRVIHGHKRLALADNETAYPYLILHRRHGLNWKMIQSAISVLSQPINVLELHKAIQEQQPI